MALNRFPFKKSVDGDDAAALAIGISERRQSSHGLALGVDRLAVPTISFQLLYGLLILKHGRRTHLSLNKDLPAPRAIEVIRSQFWADCTTDTSGFSFRQGQPANRHPRISRIGRYTSKARAYQPCPYVQLEDMACGADGASGPPGDATHSALLISALSNLCSGFSVNS